MDIDSGLNGWHFLLGTPDLSSFLPRYWDHSATDEKLVISDLPILECDGLESYGNLQGFRLRFNNFNNLAWYNEEPFNFGEHIVPVIGLSKAKANRMRQQVKNLTLWNNEIGTLPNYTSLADWSDVSLVNRLSYDEQSPYVGAEIFRQIEDTTFTNLTIDGYEVAGRLESENFDGRSAITFLTPPTYLNYVNLDTWKAYLGDPDRPDDREDLHLPGDRRLPGHGHRGGDGALALHGGGDVQHVAGLCPSVEAGRQTAEVLPPRRMESDGTDQLAGTQP